MNLPFKALPITKCLCGRPAAKFPNLLYFLFGGEKAKTQRQAAWTHKCVPCYEIGKFASMVSTKAAQ